MAIRLPVDFAKKVIGGLEQARWGGGVKENSVVGALATALDAIGEKIPYDFLMGVSGGGPYAAACARFIPERLTRTAIVCGLGPFDAPNATQGMGLQNRILFAASRCVPGLVGALMAGMMNRARSNPDKMMERMKASLPDVDRRALERPEARDIFLAGSDPPRADLGRAIAQEAALYVDGWGFELSDIRAEVHLYQGELDLNVSPTMGRVQVARIPNCTAHFYPEEGHMSLVLNRGEEFLGPFAL